MYYHWRDRDLILDCRIRARAGEDAFAGVLGDRLKLRISAPPVDGKANAHLLKFLARAFATTPRQLQILQGESSRDKRILIKEPVALPDLPGLDWPQD